MTGAAYSTMLAAAAPAAAGASERVACISKTQNVYSTIQFAYMGEVKCSSAIIVVKLAVGSMMLIPTTFAHTNEKSREVLGT